MTAQVLRRPHFLLVTLVLCNAAATEVRGISFYANVWHAITDLLHVVLSVKKFTGQERKTVMPDADPLACLSRI